MPASLPAEAWTVALAGLPGMGPTRLAALLARWEPREAWCRILDGDVHKDPGVVAAARTLGDPVTARWREAAVRLDVGACWDAHRRAGVGVLDARDPRVPAVLAADPEPPAVLFHIGDLAALDRPRVAVVGTRRCTWAGRATAAELGADLARAGVCVISGLALGIDGASHAGALGVATGAAPVAVVGTGLDVVYPRRHARLWADVAGAGAVLSEYPLGTRPEPWRFPARNRLIAALADVVVVVESHERGGSMHTVESAIERGRTVMAVPGPVRSPASAGTNGLLASGCAPVRDAGDVLVALGLDAAAAARGAAPTPPTGTEGAVLAALGWEASTLEHLAARSGLSLPSVATALARLEQEGWVVRQAGWYERAEPVRRC